MRIDQTSGVSSKDTGGGGELALVPGAGAKLSFEKMQKVGASGPGPAKTVEDGFLMGLRLAVPQAEIQARRAAATETGFIKAQITPPGIEITLGMDDKELVVSGSAGGAWAGSSELRASCGNPSRDILTPKTQKKLADLVKSLLVILAAG